MLTIFLLSPLNIAALFSCSRIKQGKKSTVTDDKYFKQAEDVLFSELSFVLDIPKENMVQFIEDMIKADLL